ncbi:hypothetical protein ACFE04_022061 [Oxalis oulophora]
MNCNGMAFFSTNFILQNPHEDDHHHHQHNATTSLNSLLPCGPQEFNGMVPFLGKRSSMSFSGMDVCGEDGNGGEEELSDDDGSQAGEKKRRLNMEQVKTLEKNFELGNKLEPERKMHLARTLGLQPRQIAIWFQNRRARWKTKQLEKDYDVLKRQYDVVKADNDSLQAQNQKLHAEIMGLKSRELHSESINLNIKETEGSSSENSCEIKLDMSTTTTHANEESPHHNLQPTFSRALFPSRPTGIAHLFGQNAPSQSQIVKEEGSLTTNMFCVETNSPSPPPPRLTITVCSTPVHVHVPVGVLQQNRSCRRVVPQSIPSTCCTTIDPDSHQFPSACCTTIDPDSPPTRTRSRRPVAPQSTPTRRRLATVPVGLFSGPTSPSDLRLFGPRSLWLDI